MEVVRASLDRFEGEFAVIYSDTDDRKFTVPRGMVTARPGSRVVLHLENDEVKRIEIDVSATKSARDRIREKYKRLTRKGVC